jgi:hypothetical protein
MNALTVLKGASSAYCGNSKTNSLARTQFEENACFLGFLCAGAGTGVGVGRTQKLLGASGVCQLAIDEPRNTASTVNGHTL